MTHDRTPSVIESAFDRIGLFAGSGGGDADTRSTRSFYSARDTENRHANSSAKSEKEEEEERKQRFW